MGTLERKASRRSRGNVTIGDVAREAGVSAMTVSRVINRERNVRPETRKAVLHVIERMNYLPNSAARDLAAGEETRIGLLYANPSAAYLSEFLIGALEAARIRGLHLVIEHCTCSDITAQIELAGRFEAARIAGAILSPPLSESRPLLTELAAVGIPFVTVATGKPCPTAINVRIDDFGAAKEMTEYLISLGHRSIGFICGDPTHSASAERERGFRRAVADAGLPPSSAAVEHGMFTYRSGLEAAEKLLVRRPQPTAIFASNDDMASAVVSVAHRRGLVVPGDLSIVGFDDTAPATTVWPELTTVRQPIAAMAAKALELLLADLRERREGKLGPEREVVLRHELVKRESSGFPRKFVVQR